MSTKRKTYYTIKVISEDDQRKQKNQLKKSTKWSPLNYDKHIYLFSSISLSKIFKCEQIIFCLSLFLGYDWKVCKTNHHLIM